jgi:hypothetical protein
LRNACAKPSRWQRLLLRVHGVGDVDRDHQREVDLGGGAGRQEAEAGARETDNERLEPITPGHRDPPAESSGRVECASFGPRCKRDGRGRKSGPEGLAENDGNIGQASLVQRSNEPSRRDSTSPTPPEGGLGVELGGVEKGRVLRRAQRSGGAARIARVPSADVGENRLEAAVLPLREKLAVPPLGPHLGRGRHEQLDVGLRADHGADVAAVEHGAAVPSGEAALEVEQRLAHGGNGGDDRGRLAHLATAQARLVEAPEIQRPRRRFRGRRILERAAGVEKGAGDPAVDEAGVEVRQPEMVGEAPRERPLAGGRRPVDGDDHAIAAPSSRIRGTKLGKLVAIIAPSSTVIPSRAARPMTRKAMAMRWSRWVRTVPPPGTAPSRPWTTRSSPSTSCGTCARKARPRRRRAGPIP